MDPTTLATAVTAFLVPFLSKVGQGVAEQAQQKLPDQVNRIWDSIVARFKGKPTAEGCANDLKAQADDADNQAAFALQLKKLLKDDETFTAELEKLLHSAQTTTGNANTGNGALATHGGVASGAGGFAVGGNVGGNIVLGNYNRVSANSSG